MITSNIGKIFLKAYNEKYNTSYDAKTFFIEQFYPVIFDHKKYMMTGGNSPLENPKLSWEKMIRGNIPFESDEKRQERFQTLLKKIEDNEADASIAMGYYSLSFTATTSGQISNLGLSVSKNDIYLSWIGACLGLGVQGGFSILFYEPDILLDIFYGWEIYRKALNTTTMLKGNQINTWNSQWLAHYYDSREYDANDVMANFDLFSSKDGLISIDTVAWTKVLIGISRKFRNIKMIGYVYNFGQTNTTIGFIPFVLDEIRRPINLYKKLFGTIDAKIAETIWGTAYGFKTACQNGNIGIIALEPKGLRAVIKEGKILKIKNTNEEQIKFNVYKTWIMAILNNEQLWAKAGEFAQELSLYADLGEKGRTGNRRKVDSVISATNKNIFIKNLIEVVSDAKNKGKIEEMAELINSMPTDNVPYFLTLVRFHYASISNNI